MKQLLLGRAGLHLHRSERTDVLIGQLAKLLAESCADPFSPEVIAVPTQGIERFLSQELSQRLGVSDHRSDGVCANVRFPSPMALVADTLAEVTGSDRRSDPWEPSRSAWAILDVIDRSKFERWSAPLTRHLGFATTPNDAQIPDQRMDRRFAVASRLARLFSAYGSQRPEMILAWNLGLDEDGTGRALPVDLHWQPELWRRVRAEISVASPAERLAEVCTDLRATPTLSDLPHRISVFGPTRLPVDQVRVLEALAAHREVHLWVAGVGSTDFTIPSPRSQDRMRKGDLSGAGVRHPLVSSLGRDSRELHASLPELASEESIPAPMEGAFLLAHLQRQMCNDTDPWESRAAQGPVLLAASDRSIQVHSCHGQGRQAEVVREVILGLLQADDTLEPRDILVMCPDLETFAPLIAAAFTDPQESGGSRGSLGQLRIRIADRTPEQGNGVLAALDQLLVLICSRMELSSVLDLLACPPVSRKFGFDQQDLDRIADLAGAAGVRWGLDEITRSAFKVRAGGTWSAGLKRLLLGLALSESDLALVGGVLPLDAVQGSDARLIGGLAEYLTLLSNLRDNMTGSHPIAHWHRVISDVIADFTEVSGIDGWQLPNALAAVRSISDQAGSRTTQLGLADVRWMLSEVLAGRPTRANFRSGGITVCGLAPMRSVPHRVICLVGLDDGAFPRSLIPDGDDVLARNPLVGERDARNEDRQLFLDAILAARQHLVITYAGADERTNEVRPPSVPLGELLDAVDALASTTSGQLPSTQVVVRHPLQPFDGRNFRAGELGVPGAFSHDRSAVNGAHAAAKERAPRAELIVGDLPSTPLHVLALRDLSRFLGSPPAEFLRSRIGLGVSRYQDSSPDRITLEMNGLQRWAVSRRVLDLRIADVEPTRIRDAELVRGELPPGNLGSSDLVTIGKDAEVLANEVVAARKGYQSSQVTVLLQLPSGRSLTGSVSDIFATTLVRTTPSRLKPRTQLQIWPELLAVSAMNPGQTWMAHLVARGGGVRFVAPEFHRSLELLDELVDLYEAGMCAPLPFLPGSAMHYALRRGQGQPIEPALRAAEAGAWASRYGPESSLEEVVKIWGGSRPLRVLLSAPTGQSERWYSKEPARFGALARRIWDPVFAATRGER